MREDARHEPSEDAKRFEDAMRAVFTLPADKVEAVKAKAAEDRKQDAHAKQV